MSPKKSPEQLTEAQFNKRFKRIEKLWKSISQFLSVKRGKKPTKELTEAQFDKKLKRFEKLWSTISGRVDVKSRLMLLLNPDVLETTTRLTAPQVQFIAQVTSAVKQWPFLKPLDDYARQFMLANISLRGEGREESIRFVASIVAKDILSKLGLSSKEEIKVKEVKDKG